ncbi:hypothetical protein SUGI_1186770 [Cryptomeria japonica]|nr:hypothetical protein SUGI_1186770 [Cryptomeria japonica]
MFVRSFGYELFNANCKTTERFGCGFIQPAALKGDTYSTNNDFQNFTLTDGSCPLLSLSKNYGAVDYINPKINCSNNSGQMGKNAGTIMSSKVVHKFVERKRRRDMQNTVFWVEILTAGRIRYGKMLNSRTVIIKR